MKIKKQIAAMACVGIFFACSQDPSSNLEENPNPGAPGSTPATSACTMTIDESAKFQVDSLIQEANLQMVEEMGNFLSSLKTNDWSESKATKPTQSKALYEQALQLAPNYCPAQLGSAMIGTMNIVDDEEINTFMNKIQKPVSTETEPSVAPASFLGRTLSMPIEETPEALLQFKLAVSENTEDFSGNEILTLIEEEFYPRLDTLISKVQGVYDTEQFYMNIEIEGQVTQIDRGEIGPLLGGLKIMKAFIILAVAHQFPIDLNGNMDWLEEIDGLRSSDYDNLSAEQKAALDHLTALFKGENGFGDLRTGWAASYEGIPHLLTDALSNIKGGLEYGVYEANNNGDQTNDLYVVGNHENADVSIEELQDGIEFIDRIKKYFEGSQTLVWGEGAQSLEINLPALFKIQNPLKMLPLFEFRPYEEWNDLVAADTAWGLYFYNFHYRDQFLNALSLPLALKEDYSSSDAVRNGDLVTSSLHYETDSGTLTIHAQYIPSTPCEQLLWVNEDQANAISLHLEACGGNHPDGPYIFRTSQKTKSPFFFVDIHGNQTWDPGAESQKIESLEGLTGKVQFADATFNGTFPNLTNENFWVKIQSMESISNKYKSQWVCSETECVETTPELSENPTDLDYFSYFIETYLD